MTKRMLGQTAAALNVALAYATNDPKVADAHPEVRAHELDGCRIALSEAVAAQSRMSVWAKVAIGVAVVLLLLLIGGFLPVSTGGTTGPEIPAGRHDAP